MRKLSNAKLRELYRAILLPRLIEEKMLILLRQGRISKWFSGIGQEAISVGCTLALKPEEFILPMHRNLGVFTSRNVGLVQLFKQFQGHKDGFTKGRDRSFHFGSLEHRIVGMISHLGAQLGLADGIALANKLDGKDDVCIVFSGEGGTSEGDFHEALNLAAVWDLPVIFVVENNGYGLSTPTSDQFRAERIADKGIGYGMAALSIDGNDIETVYSTVSQLAKAIRKKSAPVLLECLTFRMRGHEEASGSKYVPQELIDEWAKKDPVQNFENKLLNEGILASDEIETMRSEIKSQIQNAVDEAYVKENRTVSLSEELGDLFRPFEDPLTNPSTNTKDLRLIDAIKEGLEQAMVKHPDLVLMGQDIAEYGGVFKITEGFVDKFGIERVRNTPICESAVVGAAMGLSLAGKKGMMEMQFSDFVSCGFNQIVNNLAKVQYRWNANADVVIRMPCGGGVGAGPFHSQSVESWFFHTPGLKIVYPSRPSDAKGLLLRSFEDPNPVLFFEHKALYRSISEEVPEEYFTLEIGKGRIANVGKELTVITYGMGVHWCHEYIGAHPDSSIELIDLMSLQPWDKELVKESVMKTGKAMVVHEACLSGGVGAELAAWIGEHLFEYLDAPVFRHGSMDTPVPFSAVLEEQFFSKNELFNKLAVLRNF